MLRSPAVPPRVHPTRHPPRTPRRRDEWVVDTVSAGGEHKALALWRYAKEEANGAPFVYSFMELRPVDGEEAAALVRYACDALDALQWRWGPCHTELMATCRGPVLVEVNAGRFSGGDFKQLVDLCVGANAYEATLDAYARDGGRSWEHVPPLPPAALRGCGRMVTLVSGVAGTLRRVRHLDLIEALPSFVSYKPAYAPGDVVQVTLDLATVAGHVMLAHADPEVLEADYARLRELQNTMFDVGDAVGDADRPPDADGVNEQDSGVGELQDPQA